MNLQSLSLTLAGFASGLENHLWQSTVFALAATLLTLALRRNQARTRHWVWLAASLKFLVPFSLLVALGSHLAPSRPIAPAPAAMFFAVEEASQPFTMQFEAAASVPAARSRTHWLPIVLAAVWVAGFLAVLAVWLVYWRKIASAVRKAAPARGGRELELLRRLEQMSPRRSSRPIQLLLSPSNLGPGIYGITRPRLLWPAAISDRLDDAHLESVLAHEICHVRRRDNFTAALHMLVEAIFWFHPLVWWIGARLEGERERACDEAVLEASLQPHVYAESILKICEFYVESPLPCVSGVTGADLKQRMVNILAARKATPLSFTAKVLLVCVAAIAIAAPFVVGAQMPVAVMTDDWQKAAGGKMAFDVATIRLDNLGIPPAGPPPQTNVDLDPGELYTPTGGILRMQNKSLRTLIAFAYKMNGDQQLYLKDHVPGFVLTDRFDLEARTENTRVTKDQMRLMMQSLLAERFKLAVQKQTIEATVLGLTPVKAGKLGPQIRPHQANDPVCSANDASKDRTTWVTPTDGYPLLCGSIMGMPSPPGHPSIKIGGRNVPMRLIAEALVAPYTGDTGLSHPVIDTTGLTGTFDFTLELEFTEMESTFTPNTGAAFVEELRDQLGLKLQSQKGPEEVYVVDHVERLSGQDKAEATEPLPPALRSPSGYTYVSPPMRVPVALVEKKPMEGGAGTQQSQAPDDSAKQLSPMAKDAHPSFEVVTVRRTDPNDSNQGFHIRGGHRIFIENETVGSLISFAYGVHQKQIADAPAWVDADPYDINGVPDVEGIPSLHQLQEMVQKLLADRFNLKFRREKRELSIYEITVAKGGPKLARSESDPDGLPDQTGNGHGNEMRMKFTNNSMSDFALGMQYIVGKPVVDQTELTGRFDFALRWTPGDSQTVDPNAAPGIFTAMQEQLGLKLEPTKGPADVLVIDHVERPSGN